MNKHHRQSRHDDLVHDLLYRPYKMNLSTSDILIRTSEYEMLHGCDIYVAPDIYFLMKDGKHLFYEVKTSTSKACMNKGYKQCQKVHDWMNEHLETPDVQTYLVYPRNYKKTLVDLIVEYVPNKNT